MGAQEVRTFECSEEKILRQKGVEKVCRRHKEKGTL
jgi:hypothetical protein